MKILTQFNDLEQALVIGDCILVDGTSFISDGIEWFENGKVSHVALYTGDDEVIEATETGVKCNKIAKYYTDKYNWCVRRIPNLTAEQSQKMVDGAWKLIGKKYDFFQFFGLALFFIWKRLTGKKVYWLIGQSGDDMMICSELYTMVARDAGIELLPVLELKAVTPEDLYDTNELITIKELRH
jgi:hypothetical protein